MPKKITIFADRLRKARAYRGLKQSQVGAPSGLPQTYISNLECGERTPRIETLAVIADALDVSVDYLLGRVNGFESQVDSGPRGYSKLSSEDRKVIDRLVAIMTRK